MAILDQANNITNGFAGFGSVGFLIGGGKGAEVGAWLGIFGAGAAGMVQRPSGIAESPSSVSGVLPPRTPQLLNLA